MQTLLFDLYNIVLTPRFRYTDGVAQFRARVILFGGVLVSFATVIVLISFALLSARFDNINDLLSITFGVLLFQIVNIALVHSGQLRAAMVLNFTFFVVLTLVLAFLVGIAPTILALAYPLIFAGLTLHWAGVLAVWATQTAAVVVSAVFQAHGLIRPLNTIPEGDLAFRITPVLVILFGVAMFAALVSVEIRRFMRYNSRLLIQLRAAGEIINISTAVSGPAELYQRLVNYIRDRFGFYHVQLFLVDAERRYANLVAGTGDTGELLIQRGYRLAIGSKTPVSAVLQSGEATVITNRDENTDGAPSRRANELLRDTRSELVLPLIVGDQIIGVLDVQSARPDTFVPELVESLRILAGQIAMSVHSSRTLDDAKVAQNDMRRLLLDAELDLREAQRLNQKLTGQAWEDYLKARSAQTVGYTLLDNRLGRDPYWTPALMQAATSRRAVISADGPDRVILAVPIELRGRSIGAIEMEIDGNIRQAETLEILQSVSQRLALSIDNARLFEQAQEIAHRELEVNTISSNLQGINDISELARATLQELTQALGASNAAIRLGGANIDPAAS